jgi:uncharacterized cupredoxin-like copper-binding protein
MRFKMFSVVLVVAGLSLAACGGSDSVSTQTVTATVTTPAPAAATEAAVDRGTVVNVQMGEEGATFFVRPEQDTVAAGPVTFAVTNMGQLYHEFIVVANPDGIDPGSLPVANNEADEAQFEANIMGEAPYATPPIVPDDHKVGDSDHRMRPGWGAELTLDLKAGSYILICNIEGHYPSGKQYAPFTVT